MVARFFTKLAASPSATPNPAAPAVEAYALQKRYQAGAVAVAALRGINLRVERGEFVAIAGPSGCGKTSLLNCLAGLETEYEGEIFLAGVPLRGLKDSQRAILRARTTGFIFQSFNLLPTLDAIENVELPLLITGVRGGEARRRAREILDAVGLGDRLDHRPAALSGGQQQRVAIARALVGRPAIVWADEPTGNLDSDSAAEIIDLIERLNRENGQTFVIVTHATDVAARASRLVRMRDGMIIEDSATTPRVTVPAQRDRRAAD